MPGTVNPDSFKLYALDRLIELSAGATKRQLLDAMKGHTLAQAELIGTYKRLRCTESKRILRRISERNTRDQLVDVVSLPLVSFHRPKDAASKTERRFLWLGNHQLFLKYF